MQVSEGCKEQLNRRQVFLFVLASYKTLIYS